MGKFSIALLIVCLCGSVLGANGQQELGGAAKLKAGSNGTMTVVPQTLTASGYNVVAYSPDGTLAAAASQSGMLLVWRLSDHLLIHRLTGYDEINALAFSPSSRYLAVVPKFKLSVLDLQTGKESYSEELQGSPWFAGYGSDDDTLVLIAQPYGLEKGMKQLLEDDAQGVTLFLQRFMPASRRVSFMVNLTGAPTCLYLSHRDKTAAFGTQGGAVVPFNPESLSLKKPIKLGTRIDGIGRDSQGRYKIATNDELLTLDDRSQVASRSELTLRPSGSEAHLVWFSPDEAIAMAVLPGSEVSAIDLDTAETLFTCHSSYGVGGDGWMTLALSATHDEWMMTSWSVASNSPFYNIRGESVNNGLPAAWAIISGLGLNDGSLVMLGKADNQDGGGRLLKFEPWKLGSSWSTSRGNRVERLYGSREGDRVFLGDPANYAAIDVSGLATSYELTPIRGIKWFAPVATTPDGERLYYAQSEGEKLYLWERVLGGGADKRLTSVKFWETYNETHIELSSSGDRILLSHGHDYVVYEVSTKRDLFRRTTGEGTWHALSSDGRWVAERDTRQTGTVLFPVDSPSQRFVLSDLKADRKAFSPDSRYLATMALSNVYVTDVQTKKLVRTFALTGAGRESGLWMTPDNRYVMRTDNSGVISFCNLDNGEVVHLLKTDTDWLFYTDDGYFEGSANAGKMLAIVRGPQAFGMDQLAARYNRPDLIMERLGTTKKNPDLYAFFRANYQKRLARMGLTEAQMAEDLPLPIAKILRSEVSGSKAQIELSFLGQGDVLGRYSVYVNDVPVFGQAGRPLEGTTAQDQIELELLPGENKVEVSCFSTQGMESLRVLTKLQGPPTQETTPELYYLGFGVSTYANPDLNLRYADKDALDLQRTFENMGGSAYARVHTTTFVNQQVDLQTMTNAKSFLAQARPQDTVVLFIAGHGIFTQDSTTPDYYYIAHNTDVADIEGTAIRFSEVEDLLQGIPSRHKLFLMDTCNSGEVDPLVYTKAAELAAGTAARAVRGLTVTKIAATHSSQVPRTWLAEKGRYSQNDLIRRSGAIVFSSSKGGEYSYESDRIGNGMFTSAILKALSGELDLPQEENGTIGVRALVEAVSAEVPRMTDELQHPGVDRDNLSVSFGLPMVDPGAR